MRIVLLAHNLRSAGGLSVGKNIVATLPKIAPMHKYLMVVPEGCGYPGFDGAENVEVMECPPMSLLRRQLWERRTLRRAMSHFKPGWVWALGNEAISRPPCTQSLLFHNPHRIYREESRCGVDWKGRLFKWLSDCSFEHGLRFCHRVYCQTELVRKRLNSVYGYPLISIGLCPNAFSYAIKPSANYPHELEEYKGSFILFVLTKYYPHKNLERIVEMFSRYGHTLLHDIVCVMPVEANQGKAAVQLLDKIYAEDLQQQILCVEAISQERLGDFFHAADVMFLPTLLESFSGTYLEAMNLKSPILTSDLDFARCICDDAALYIDPYSLESMRDGILKLKNNRALRKDLIEKGNQRIKKFLNNWSEILRDVLDQEGIEHD